MAARHGALDRYTSEARREPFELTVDDDRSMVIEPPSIDCLITAATKPCTVDEQLRLLVGSQYAALWDVLGSESFSVLRAFLGDIAEHFGLPEVARVADLIDRYGSALRADLRRVYGVDLLDFFRDELSAQAILDYVEHLPRTSAYHSAVADDEELAEQLAGQPGGPSRAPRLAEYSPEVQVMAEVRDLIASLIGVQISRAGKTPKKIKPYPRPESALERVRRRHRYATHRSIVDRLRPQRE